MAKRKRNTAVDAGNADLQWQRLQRRIVRCRKCPRLIEHCKSVAVKKRKAYASEKYWGKPVENFGNGKSNLLVMGLAPGAHGANRTGRMFTGDRSGDWLYRAMHKAGFANQAESSSRSDGLELEDAVVSGVCHCAPPDNKPSREEVANCQPFLARSIELVAPRVTIALGRLAWTEILRLAKLQRWYDPTQSRPPAFTHGAEYQFAEGMWLLASYHPSQQNTFTGRLTEPMFDAVFSRAKVLCQQKMRRGSYPTPADEK